VIKPRSRDREEPSGFLKVTERAAEAASYAAEDHDGKDRLIFVDYVYPYHKQLKAGITVFLLLVDYKTNSVMLRCLANKDQTIATPPLQLLSADQQARTADPVCATSISGKPGSRYLGSLGSSLVFM
jgi:hypothetical protein